jgi:hypothetical protein
MDRFTIGFIVGWGALSGLSIFMPGSFYNIVTDAKKECEQRLPRDESCRIIAVPENELTENPNPATMAEQE